MADKLLVRAYNVEVGDCIYCRIPKARKVGSAVDDFHILIDCGSVGGFANLKAAISDLTTMLPDANGRKRLDLLVVTHEHKDHIAGFDPNLFEGIKIENIWMSAAMNPEHPQAANAADAFTGDDRDAQHREIESFLESRAPEPGRALRHRQ